MIIPYDTFAAVDMRVGRIVEVEEFPEARKPAWKLTVDFGSEIGTKRSSAQIVALYSKEDLLNRLVIGVINFAPKKSDRFCPNVWSAESPTIRAEWCCSRRSEMHRSDPKYSKKSLARK